MKRIVLVGLVLSLSLAGCSWFIPGKVKSEAVMMRVNIETAIEETKALPDDPTKQKALRALFRMYPHTVNWDDYVHGRPATRQYDPRFLPENKVTTAPVPSPAIAEVMTPRSADYGR